MLKSVTMLYFKQHAMRTIHFATGVNGIRAANGSGKSNALMACRYALYGAKALTEPLEEVVTWGMPVGKLKVTLEFDFAGVDYTITRGKSGAELTFSGERVTGQTEVTKFVEKLFGASQDLASKLMFAKQKAVGGALADGPTAASELIESLADLDLIDQLVGLVGEHLPAGNTAVQEAAVSTLREQTEVGELINLEPLMAAAAVAGDVTVRAIAAHRTKKAELDDLDLSAAREILSDEKVQRAAIEAAAAAITTARTAAEQAPLPAPADAAIEALRARIAAQKDLAAAQKLHAELKQADTEMLWDEPMMALEKAIEAAKSATVAADGEQDVARSALHVAQAAITASRNKRHLEIARLKGKLVLEESCAFCGKDLKDIPEVALNNNPLYAQIRMLEEQVEASTEAEEKTLAVKQVSYQEALTELRALEAVVKVSEKLGSLYGRASKFINLDTSVVPAQWTWTGPTGEAQDFSGELAVLLEQQRAAVKQAAQIEEALAAWNRASAALLTAQEKLAALQLLDARETLELEAELKPRVQALLDQAQLAERKLTNCRIARDMARTSNDAAAAGAERARAQLAAAEAVLAEMGANNALVKKLRAARPVITDRLWAMVLGAASTYYSDMRGDRFVFTREEGKFRVNGRPTSGMSGAEEDILGLAIRMALTRMFLPSVDFLVLDEVAAACDDDRESAILGLLSTIGFKQVILVTHSSLVDAVADTIIVL